MFASPLGHGDACLDFNWLPDRYMLYGLLCVLPVTSLKWLCVCVLVCVFVVPCGL